MKRRLLSIFSLFLLVTLLLSGGICNGADGAIEFSNPPKEILQYVPYSAGGGFDTVGRLMGKHLTQEFGISVITENRTGAGGIIPVRDVLNAKPDEHILVFIHSTAHPIQQAIFNANIKLEDLTYLGGVRKNEYILTVNKESGIEKIEDFKNKSLIAGMPSAGHICEVAVHELADAVGFEVKTLPYKGLAKVNAAMLAGEIDLALYSAIMYENNKDKLTALAVFSKNRMDFCPEVPTLGELGYGDVFFPIDMMGYAGPPGMSKEVVETYKTAIQKVINKEEIQEWAKSQGEVIVYIPPEEFKESTINTLDVVTDYEYIWK